MFVGFVAVIIVLLVVVVLMSTGVLSGGQSSQYLTEAKKAQTLLHHLKNESKFYYSKKETFDGLDMNYFAEYNFASDLMIVDTLNSADWDGWPITDPAFPATYTGPSIALGGTAGKDMRILVAPVNGGANAGFFLIKKKVSTIPVTYTKIIEKVLTEDSAYIGG